jgi:nucleotide-binding universal stress UspA family protein
LFGLFKRTTLSDRQEAAVRKTLSNLRATRRNRFRILACINGSEESYITVRTAARLAVSDDSDVIVVYVRPIDQGLHSGGLQVRLARQNMMDAGFELPGVKYLKRALEILKEEGLDAAAWPAIHDHQDAWGDPAGDNKIEYRSPTGRSVVLKLKTAPDIAVGILDQYELGPYNLMILGQPSGWSSEFKAFFGAGIVQSVSTIAPCSVLVARETPNLKGFLICTDGSSRSMQAVRRSAVLAHVTGEPITLFSVAPDENAGGAAEEAVANARALLKAMKIDVLDTKIAVGKIADEIVAMGSQFRVIVISDEGRSRLSRLIKGSIASEVLRRAQCSVLDVR